MHYYHRFLSFAFFFFPSPTDAPEGASSSPSSAAASALRSRARMRACVSPPMSPPPTGEAGEHMEEQGSLLGVSLLALPPWRHGRHREAPVLSFAN